MTKEEKKNEKLAAPMCSACRVFVCNVPARVISLENLKEKTQSFGTMRDQAKMTLPFTTSSSLEVIAKMVEWGPALDKKICCDYGNGTFFSYLDCHVEGISVSSSPGCRMEMSIVFSYLARSEHAENPVPETMSFKPERGMVWDDFLAFVDGGAEAAIKNFRRKS